MQRTEAKFCVDLKGNMESIKSLKENGKPLGLKPNNEQQVKTVTSGKKSEIVSVRLLRLSSGSEY